MARILKSTTMFDNYSFAVKERLMRYVQVDTQSDPHSNTQPSTEKQKDLARILVNELSGLGIADAHLDEFGYVYATVPSNSDKNVPVICFCAHMDTAPDCSGSAVKPILHKNYDGNDIVLPDHFASIDHAVFRLQKGQTIVEDLGSTNGTWVNGEQIHSPVQMVAGDYVKIGSITFQYSRWQNESTKL